MSTRCNIGRLNNDSSVSAIYCHHDGYPEGVGKTLLEHYDATALNDLLAGGDISVLKEVPGDSDYYEDGKEATEYANLEDYVDSSIGEEFLYYMDLDSKWHCIVIHWDDEKQGYSADLSEDDKMLEDLI